MKKEWAFLKLLTTKGYRKVVLIPLAFCLGFFLYYLYTDFMGGKVEKTVYDDGTVRIYAQSDLGSCKLPKILDTLNNDTKKILFNGSIEEYREWKKKNMK